MSVSVVGKVAEFYAPPDLKERVVEALRAAGRDASNTTVADLASFDQSHVMGAIPNERLAAKLGIRPEDHGLDVGAGMGGPARLLAETYGCKVTGVDITQPYLETAVFLTELTKLTELVSFQQADATDLPFENATFDFGWTQHAAQSIPDKEKFFSEFQRVLKPGGKLVVHDLYRGASGEVHFPAMWAPDASISFLITDGEMRRVIESAGFRIVAWSDTTQEAWDANVKRAQGDLNSRNAPGTSPVPGLNITLLHGEGTMEMAMNSVKDFEVGSVGIFEAIVQKP
jgi:SAM-dependent methyltransferase